MTRGVLVAVSGVAQTESSALTEAASCFRTLVELGLLPGETPAGRRDSRCCCCSYCEESGRRCSRHEVRCLRRQAKALVQRCSHRGCYRFGLERRMQEQAQVLDHCRHTAARCCTWRRSSRHWHRQCRLDRRAFCRCPGEAGRLGWRVPAAAPPAAGESAPPLAAAGERAGCRLAGPGSCRSAGAAPCRRPAASAARGTRCSTRGGRRRCRSRAAPAGWRTWRGTGWRTCRTSSSGRTRRRRRAPPGRRACTSARRSPCRRGRSRAAGSWSSARGGGGAGSPGRRRSRGPRARGWAFRGPASGAGRRRRRGRAGLPVSKRPLPASVKPRSGGVPPIWSWRESAYVVQVRGQTGAPSVAV